MNTQEIQDWEKEFDEKSTQATWNNGWLGECCDEPDWDSIKEFISKLLDEQEARHTNKVIEDLRKMKNCFHEEWIVGGAEKFEQILDYYLKQNKNE